MILLMTPYFVLSCLLIQVTLWIRATGKRCREKIQLLCAICRKWFSPLPLSSKRQSIHYSFVCVTSVVFLFLLVPLKVRCAHFVSFSSNFVETRTRSIQIKIVQIIGCWNNWILLVVRTKYKMALVLSITKEKENGNRHQIFKICWIVSLSESCAKNEINSCKK